MEANITSRQKTNLSSLCFFIFIMLSPLGLFGCASSSVERSAAAEVDYRYESSNDLLERTIERNPANEFQNAPQITKGVVVGATAGGILGGVASGAIGIWPGAASGAVVGGILGAYIDHHTNLLDQLENRGARIMVLGDQVKIVLPSALLFIGMTPKLRLEAFSTLDLMGKIINHVTSMSIKVAAYSNDVGSPEVNCIVTKQQAETIVKYLWKQVNTRLLFAEGMGPTNLIERNNVRWDGGANYRIEITFEKLPV